MRRGGEFVVFAGFGAIMFGLVVWFGLTVHTAKNLALPKVAVTMAPAILSTNVPTADIHQYGLVAADLGNLDDAGLNARLAAFKALGVSWVRLEVPWSSVQAAGPSVYNWADADRVIAAVSKAHLHMLVILDYTPPWARVAGCTAGNKCAPADAQKFATYAKAAVARYKDKVTSWEIWNEPNRAATWAPAPDASAYARLLGATYAAVKQADSAATVITGGLAPAITSASEIAPPDFIRGMYAAGAGGHFDAVGAHPYSYPAPPNYQADWNGWTQMLQVHNIMATVGDSTKPIWITEFGAPTNGPGATATSADFLVSGADHVDEQTQAADLTQAVDLYKSYSWVGPFFWYNYQDLGTNRDTVENFFGLLRADGSKKPAYAVFQKLIQ